MTLSWGPACPISFRSKSHQILVPEDDPHPLTVQQTSLDRLISDHLRPGTFLFKNPRNPNFYELRELSSTTVVPNTGRPPETKQPNSKPIKPPFVILRMNHPPAFIMEQMSKLYRWIEPGRIPEIHAYCDQAKGANRGNNAFQNLLDETLHFRPDVILRSMLAGTGFLVNPQRNGVQYGWVMGRGPGGSTPRNITHRFENRRAAQLELGINPKTDQHILSKIKLSPSGNLNPRSGDLNRYRRYKEAGGNEVPNNVRSRALKLEHRRPRTEAEQEKRREVRQLRAKAKREKKRDFREKKKRRLRKQASQSRESRG